MLRSLAPLLVTGLLAGCTGSAPTAPTTAPSPAANPSAVASLSATPPTAATPAPSTASPSDVVLAVAGETDVTLYRLRGGGVRAERVRGLAPPTGASGVFDVSLSAGPTPVTCAVWRLGADVEAFELRCYDWGDSTGRPVRGADRNTTALAVRADGRALAWADGSLNSTLRVGRLVDGQVTDVKSYVGDPGKPPGNDPNRSFSGRGPAGLAWAGPDALAISVGGESDEGSGLRRFVPGVTQGGWLYRDDVPAPALDRVYDGVSSATSTTAWALERAQGVVDSDEVAPTRAVEVALPSGRVTRVISEPAEGRHVVSVSGGVRALVYVTQPRDAETDPRVYVRYPGEPRGTRVSGLEDRRLVIAGG